MSTPALPDHPWRATVIGALGFCIASMAVFGSWALAGRWMYENLSELGAYTAWALMFIGIAGATLRPLARGGVSAVKFSGIFAAAFLVYAAAWTLAWFTLRNRAGEWIGSMAGTGAMSIVFLGAFGAWQRSGQVFASVFLAHSLGYFAGSFLYAAVPGKSGMLLWGLAYGLGFGAGIGRALYYSQGGLNRPVPDAL